MALLSFPANPANNQLYPTNPAIGQTQYRWSASESTWRIVGVSTGVVAGTYGDANNVGQFTVDATGGITFAQNIPLASGGTVTAITAGTGLTGGMITATGTIALDTTYTDILYLQLAGGTMTGDITFSGTQTFPAQNLQKVTDAGNATTNAIDVAGLEVAGMFYPLADGTANQVMSTDGAGGLGWLSTLKIVTAPTASTDAGALGQVAVSTGFLYFYDGTQWLQVAGSTF